MKKPSVLKTISLGLLAGAISGAVIVGGQASWYAWQKAHQPVQQTVQAANASSAAEKKDDKEPSAGDNNRSTAAYNKVADATVSVLNYQQTTRDKLAPAGEGSGVLYTKDSKHAYLVTNNHVIDKAKKLQVLLRDGKKLDARLVGTDALSDIAVLEVDSSKVTATATFADSDAINVGETVLAIGSPLGSEYASSVTEGIISAKKRLVQSETSKNTNHGGAMAIQTDAAINPGNSGGPLINMAGQIVGINSMKLARSGSGTTVEGMGFAIPSNQVVTIANRLVKDGKVVRPSLGVGVVNLSQLSAEDQRDVLKVDKDVTDGVVITKASSDGVAARAGLKRNDVITEVDGHKVATEADLRELLYQHNLNDQVTITAYRGDTVKTFKVTLSQKLAA